MLSETLVKVRLRPGHFLLLIVFDLLDFAFNGRCYVIALCDLLGKQDPGLLLFDLRLIHELLREIPVDH